MRRKKALAAFKEKQHLTYIYLSTSMSSTARYDLVEKDLKVMVDRQCCPNPAGWLKDFIATNATAKTISPLEAAESGNDRHVKGMGVTSLTPTRYTGCGRIAGFHLSLLRFKVRSWARTIVTGHVTTS